jgi:hypothetical protein
MTSSKLDPETPEKAVVTKQPKPLVGAEWKMEWNHEETKKWFSSHEARKFLTDIMSGAIE